MKKIFFYILLVFNLVLLSSFFIAPYVMAAETIDTSTIYWDWSGPTPEDSGLPSANAIANDLEFRLYVSDQSGIYNIGTPDFVITYAESVGDPLDYDFTLTINGVGGTTTTKYFVLTAWYNSGESGTSNEVFKDFVIPMDKPLQLRFTITVE